MSTVNPFGRVVPDDDPNPKNIHTILNIATVVSVIILVIVFVGNGIVVNKFRSEAIDSIQKSNEKAMIVGSTLTDDSDISTYRDLKNTSTDENVKKASDVITKTANSVAENPLELISATMSNEEGVQAAIRPITACTMTEIAGVDTQLSHACSEYNQATETMMNTISAYNKVMDSFSGKISWVDKTPLPDLTKSEANSDIREQVNDIAPDGQENRKE